MESSRTGRADVHTGPQADRIEPFEDGDVLCGISDFSHEKSPANRALAGTSNSTRTSGRYLPSRDSQRQFLRPLCGGPRHESLVRVSQLPRRASRSVLEDSPATLLRVRENARGAVPARTSAA